MEWVDAGEPEGMAKVPRQNKFSGNFAGSDPVPGFKHLSARNPEKMARCVGMRHC